MKRGALGLEIWAGQFLELDGAANSVVGKMHATLPPPPMGMHSAYFPLLLGSALRWPLPCFLVVGLFVDRYLK